jgi:hypothetical protein
MRRSNFLRLTGINAGRFNVMARRNLLPLARSSVGEWSDYTADDALKTLLASTLGESGASLVQSRALVNDGYDDLLKLASRVGDSSPILFGRLTLGAIGMDEEETASLSVPLATTRERIDQDIRDIQLQLGDDGEALGVLLVSASSCLRRILIRARQSGLSDARLDKLSTMFGLTDA